VRERHPHGGRRAGVPGRRRAVPRALRRRELVGEREGALQVHLEHGALGDEVPAAQAPPPAAAPAAQRADPVTESMAGAPPPPTRLLVTGGAGFIGSTFVKLTRARHPDDLVVDLDARTYAGNLETLAALERDPKHLFVKGDIL